MYGPNDYYAQTRLKAQLREAELAQHVALEPKAARPTLLARLKAALTLAAFRPTARRV